MKATLYIRNRYVHSGDILFVCPNFVVFMNGKQYPVDFEDGDRLEWN